jgi:hypothetical protein
MLRFAVGVCCSVWFGEILSVPELYATVVARESCQMNAV